MMGHLKKKLNNFLCQRSINGTFEKKKLKEKIKKNSVKCPCSVRTFEKKRVEKKNQKKMFSKIFCKSIPIKVWPRQQKNKRKKKNN